MLELITGVLWCMVKAAGIDSGTKSVDIYAFDDSTGEILIDEAIPRDLVTKDPSIVIEKIREAEERFGSFDSIAVASGYGIPLKRAQEASDEEIALATFVSDEDVARGHRILGLRKILLMFRDSRFNAYFVPGVIQLPTVPRYRKVNKIDMGTSDKVFSVVLAIKDQAERLGIGFEETSFILVEIGYAYTSAIAVENGKIVDAMAGTAGFTSFLGLGFMDSELAYAISNISKMPRELLFRGGVADYAGTRDIEEFIKAKGEAYHLFIESIVKDIAALLPSIIPREIILSGRFTRIPEFFDDVKKSIKEFFSKLNLEIDVVKLQTRARVAKEAAEGAAVLANSLAGGKYKDIAEVLGIRNSSGTIFDYVCLPLKDELINTYKKLKL